MAAKVGDLTLQEFQDIVESIVEQKIHELFADDEDTLELNDSLRERLLQQMQSVTSGDYGIPMEEILLELRLE